MSIFYSTELQEGGQNLFLRFFRSEDKTGPLQSFVLAIGEVNSENKLLAQVRSLGRLARLGDALLHLETEDPILITK